MSISSEITRISGNVSDALTAIGNKGVTVPSGSNSDDLATLIGQISGSSTLVTKTITANGTYSALDDNADGYSSVTVAVPNAFSITDVSNTSGTTAQITAGTGASTNHTIHLEFTDSTDTDINLYYTDSLIGTMITAYSPSGDWTYSSKTVDSAALDNTTWYQRPSETWETIWNSPTNFNYEPDGDYPYCWISDLGNVTIAVGSVWRITYDNVQYRSTAAYDSGYNFVAIGNPKYAMLQDNGEEVPYVFYNQGYGALTGELDVPNVTASYQIKIERLVTS